MKINPYSMLLAATTAAVLLMNPVDAFLARQGNCLDCINNPSQTTNAHIDSKRIKNEKKVPVLEVRNVIQDSILDMCAVLIGRLIIV